MMTSIVMLWILYKLNAPWWAHTIVWLGLVVSLISAGSKLYKLGQISKGA